MKEYRVLKFSRREWEDAYLRCVRNWVTETLKRGEDEELEGDGASFVDLPEVYTPDIAIEAMRSKGVTGAIELAERVEMAGGDYVVRAYTEAAASEVGTCGVSINGMYLRDAYVPRSFSLSGDPVENWIGDPR